MNFPTQVMVYPYIGNDTEFSYFGFFKNSYHRTALTWEMQGNPYHFINVNLSREMITGIRKDISLLWLWPSFLHRENSISTLEHIIGKQFFPNNFPMISLLRHT